jgi:hypothetical protein
MKTSACFIIVLMLLCLALPHLASTVQAEADSSEFPALSMPVEYVNYTITSINGSLWAKIDGAYPMALLNQSSLKTPYLLPMVYPIPPGTVNINISLDAESLKFSNYTAQNHEFLHHTAIGDWAMIYTILPLSSNKFTLKIHYEHPLESVNGSYLFLYDLNISPYLSEKSPNSTAYFTIRLQTNASDIKAYTTQTDTDWKPISFTSQNQGTNQTVSIVIHSEFQKPLLGDLVFEFSSPDQVPEYPVLAVAVLSFGLTLTALLFIKLKRLPAGK